MSAWPLDLLLVEDNPGDARLVREALRCAPEVAVHHVDRLSAALAHLSTKPTDAILLDLGLPDSQGLETVRLVVEAAAGKPIVVLTGQDDASLGVAAVKAGAEDYLAKGAWTEQALHRAILYAVERVETRARLRHVNQVLRAVRGVNQLIVRERDVQKLVTGCCRELAQPGGFDCALVCLVDASGRIQTKAACAVEGAESGWLDEVAAAKPSACLGVVLAHEGVLHGEALARVCAGCTFGGRHTHSRKLVTRLECRGKVHGLLGVSRAAGSEVTDDEQALIRELADDLAFALGSIEEEQHRVQAEAVLAVRLRLMDYSASHTLEEVLRKTLDEVEPLTGSQIGFYHFVAKDQQTVSLQTWSTRTRAEFCRAQGAGLHYPVTEAGVWADCVRERRTIVHNDYAALPGRRGLPEGHAQLVRELVAPIFRDGLVVAILGVGNKPTDYTEADVASVTYLADVAFEAAQRKRAEEERETLRTSLAQSDRMASMGMLAAGVAHEINNPLAYVLYNLESLAEDLPEFGRFFRRYRDLAASRLGPEGAAEALGYDPEVLTPATFDDALARLRDAVAGTACIKAITRSLGTFSRVEQGEAAPVSLPACVEHAVTMAANELKYRARVVLDLGPVPAVLATEGKLAQVFLNLLINAAHAIDEGHVEQNEVRARTWAEGDDVFAEVRDTGRGIAPEHQARLFEPFFTTKPVGVGSGLGLSICKRIVNEFGGDISFQTEPGKGTRFLVRLPRLPEDWALKADGPPSPAATPGTRVRGRILAVDDELGIRASITRMLQADHEVVTACSGEEARALLEKDRAFDLVFCDLMMPTMSGMELHAWLAREDPQLAEQVVFVTGGAFTPGASAYLAGVGNLRVEKPFDAKAFKKMTAELVLAARSKRSLGAAP